MHISLFQIKSDQIAKPEQKSPLHSSTGSPKPPWFIHWPWVTPGRHFCYPKTCFCSLLLPVSFQHLGSGWLPFLPLSLACFLPPKESGKVSQQVFWRARVLWDNRRRGAGKGPGDSRLLRKRLLLSASEGDQARRTHGGQRCCVRAIFTLFCHCSFRSSRGGGSVHHQQQPFFF